MNTWQACNQAIAFDWEHIDATQVHPSGFLHQWVSGSRVVCMSARHIRLPVPHRPQPTGLRSRLRSNSAVSRLDQERIARMIAQRSHTFRYLECSEIDRLR